MKKVLQRLSLMMVAMLFALVAQADQKEKVIYSTTFQDWDDVSASTTAVDVKKTTTDNQDLTFTFFNTAVDADGTNAKFTGEDCTAGYWQTQKSTTDVAYVTLSALTSVTKIEFVQAATGGTRGATLYVKGDGDADWVEIHNKSIATASGEKLSYDINRTNCQIKFGTFAPAQNSYVLSLKIYGNVEVAPRTFVDTKIDFRVKASDTQAYTVVTPTTGDLPSCVTMTDAGSYKDAQHGTQNAKLTVTVDGPVKFMIGGCNFTNKATVSVDGGDAIDIDTQSAGCENKVTDIASATYTKYATYTYNVEKTATLTFDLGNYCPYFIAEACDYVADVTVTYYDTDGTKIADDVVGGGSKLIYKYGESDVTVPAGQAFRGWFESKAATAVKVAEGKELTEDLKLYAKATPIETATVGTHYDYDLTQKNFYQEDHEMIDIDGAYYNNHGWKVNANGAIKLQVAGKCYVNVKQCQYTETQTIKVTDTNGNEVKSIDYEKGTADGTVSSFTYDGDATTLSITYPSGGYVHEVEVYNVSEFIEKDATTGYYILKPGDGASLMMLLKSAQEGDKIYLPNGTYDFGEAVLNTVSANNLSIVGESMDGTIIKNAPDKSIEGIGTTATILNTSNGLYMQDLTIQNALDYYGTGAAGRAVCLQDKGANTICKNVKMLSYQDTYYSNAAKNFYWEDCEIHGTVDYVCGDGDVVYNRCKFVNESRSASSASGSDVIAAPYITAYDEVAGTGCKWGYVFLDCSVESKCKDFTFARSWGGESKAQFVRTTIKDNSLNSSRWTIAGMNVAAYKFMEYKTMDASGSVISPASNVVEFTHSSGNKKYETIMTDAEAAEYTVANIYGNWGPDAIAAQKSEKTDVVDGNVFLLEDGTITTTVPTEGKVRVANARGGFGPEIDLDATAISAVAAQTTETKAFEGAVIKDGKAVIIKNGKEYTLAGQVIK